MIKLTDISQNGEKIVLELNGGDDIFEIISAFIDAGEYHFQKAHYSKSDRLIDIGTEIFNNLEEIRTKQRRENKRVYLKFEEI